MSFGIHHALVQEVLDFVQNGPLLKARDLPSATSKIFELPKAKKLAWETDFGSEENSWTDIREKEVSAVKAVSHKLEGSALLAQELSKSTVSFSKLLKPRLSS